MGNDTKNSILGGDSRLRKMDSNQSQSRSDRSMADAERQKDGSALTSDERRAALRNEWVQEILPTIPPIAGYHLCWLSTTNSNDPIYKRQQIGYMPVMVNEVPGFESFQMKGGAFDGAVHCNEMVLFKLPMERYMDLMTIYHHDMPLEEEGMLKQSLVTGDEDRDGNSLGSVEGFDNLGKNRRPSFAHI